jgi:deoxyribodipyrimidine photolyase-related protein
LSFAMNIKLLSPKEVVDRVVEEGERNKEIAISQIEGFVRQILGWREYMRGVYWAEMPGYEKLNFFKHKTHLPSFYWTGNTKMNCMKQAIKQSLNYAYAHHIQRLMITGNFALLLGVNPDEIDDWYLGIYIDAFQWVEITNTRGMSQFADGGKLATKPYISSANYINKMSNYCGKCHYNFKEKLGEKACPFNSLYWNFFIQHEDKLRKNPRIGMAYMNLDKMSDTEKQGIKNQANRYLNNIDEL